LLHLLALLPSVAKQRSLFNDPATEINELTYIIKTDLSTLHNELEVLHKWVVSHRDGTSDSSSSGPSKHEARNSTAIVDNLKQQLMTTTKSFQEVLQVRTTNLKEQNQRRKQFEAGAGGAGGSSSSSSSSSATGNAAVRKRGGNPFDALMNQAASHKSAMMAGETEATTEDAALPSDLMQDQSLILAAPVQADDYLASRAQAVENIESTIVELGEMYKRLVHIVGMQEEITLRIDANMDEALENMDKGHHQLLTYYDSISGNRWLILKVFAVLLAFLVFFMIFVA
jgi:syntaxin 5